MPTRGLCRAQVAVNDLLPCCESDGLFVIAFNLGSTRIRGFSF